MSTVLRPLPTLELPASFVRLWRDDGSSPFSSSVGSDHLDELLADFDGVERLEEDGRVAVAVVPAGGGLLSSTQRCAWLGFWSAWPSR